MPQGKKDARSIQWSAFHWLLRGSPGKPLEWWVKTLTLPPLHRDETNVRHWIARHVKSGHIVRATDPEGGRSPLLFAREDWKDYESVCPLFAPKEVDRADL